MPFFQIDFLLLKYKYVCMHSAIQYKYWMNGEPYLINTLLSYVYYVVYITFRNIKGLIAEGFDFFYFFQVFGRKNITKIINLKFLN